MIQTVTNSENKGLQMTKTAKTKPINPNRPKVSLRRLTDPKLSCALREYELNRGTQAQGVSLANWESLYAGEPVGV